MTSNSTATYTSIDAKLEPSTARSPPPALFYPLDVNNLHLLNRLAVSSMCSYAAGPGNQIANLHLSRYKSFSAQHPGLIMIEGMCVDPKGKLDDKELGIWNDEQAEKLKMIVDEIHKDGCVCCVQLSHGGRKAIGGGTSGDSNGSSAASNDVDVDVEILAPSEIAYDNRSKIPKEMTLADINHVISSFAQAAKRAVTISQVDAVEISCCNGNLLHQFMSKTTNFRHDEYGCQSIESRCKLLLDIIDQVRNQIGAQPPIFIKLSACDNLFKDESLDEFLAVADLIIATGQVSLIHVTSGKITPNSKPRYSLNSNPNIPGHIPLASVLKKHINDQCLVGCSGALDMDVVKLNKYIEEGMIDVAFIGQGFLEMPDLVNQFAAKLNYKIK
ncbi:hypothetical protein CORT_0A07190 [Candida orthopsilosis Co 90-125]|uniref:NADH:flavin oxidoreductase/NADH oxidase N-terminal domain-containing protein n=1 Tax=Candida orthopsilosis (strain 90-125) TaxID=1136231 RepID=H8WWW4_CANO9|nr:hypothetical protein CORT_0A07190 [Candida orthopsilosis Co 90-125]CCG21104.1 hypothetical protein CORT_0A07190 [Candida orthopsilosis Co 90-125]